MLKIFHFTDAEGNVMLCECRGPAPQMKQICFSQVEFERKKRRTRREVFRLPRGHDLDSLKTRLSMTEVRTSWIRL